MVRLVSGLMMLFHECSLQRQHLKKLTHYSVSNCLRRLWQAQNEGRLHEMLQMSLTLRPDAVMFLLGKMKSMQQASQKVVQSVMTEKITIQSHSIPPSSDRAHASLMKWSIMQWLTLLSGRLSMLVQQLRMQSTEFG